MWSTHHRQEPRPLRRKTHRARPPRARGFHPSLEGLEARTVLSTLTVLNTLDKGPGSLRDTITSAKRGDTIVFDPTLDGQTIMLASDQLTINKSLDIEGPGPSLLAISGNTTNRVLNINEGFTVTIAGLTITHGRGGGNNGGGGVLNVGSTLKLTHDCFSNDSAIGNSSNKSFGGGAITSRSGATLTIADCTFVGNQAVGGTGGFGEGGAIWNLAACSVSDSTFAGNQV